MLFTAERLKLVQTLVPILSGTKYWDQRSDIEVYVSKCMTKGFCTTDDQIRLCAQRFMAGKRKITPPGTARRIRDARELKKMLSNVPVELSTAITAVIQENTKIVDQYLSGNDKTLNALVGMTIKRHKTDASVIRELLIREINNQ